MIFFGREQRDLRTQDPGNHSTIDHERWLYENNRIDRTARVVETSDANKKLFHLDSVEEIRQAFANRNEGDDRNAWLYSYNPLTVDLV